MRAFLIATIFFAEASTQQESGLNKREVNNSVNSESQGLTAEARRVQADFYVSTKGNYSWPPKKVIPQPFGISAFGARAPFPEGMERGTVTLRPSKLDEKAFDLLQEAGFRFVNIWMEWHRVEKEKGKYDFSYYDKYMERLQPRGLRPIFTFCFGNPLYCKGHFGTLDEWICNTPLNTEEQRTAFANFAAAAAEHFEYKNTGAIFEIWNEPNLNSFWMGESNPEDYTKLAIKVADAIHTADADAVVIAPASSGGITNFVQEVFRLGLLNHIDGVSHHFYSGLPPEARVSACRVMRYLIARYKPEGKEFPIIDSENGYGSFGTDISEYTQAQYLVRGLLTNMLWGVDLSTWCTFIDQSTEEKCLSLEAGFGCMGTLTWDLKRKPSFEAMKTLTEELKGYKLVERVDWGMYEGSDYILLFARVDDEGGYDYSEGKIVAWTTGDQSQMGLPMGAGGREDDVKLWPGAYRTKALRVVDMLGEVKQIPMTVNESGECLISLSPSPIYINFSL